MRIALGASRSNIARSMLMESLVVAAMGALVGVAIGFAPSRWLLSFLPSLPYRFAIDPTLDLGILVTAGTIALATSLIFGLVPALRAAGTDPIAAIRGPSGGYSRRVSSMRGFGTIVVSMVALSFVALVLSGLFLRSLGRIRSVDPGFATEDRLIATLDVRLAGDPGLRSAQYFRSLVEEVSALPGVRSAAVTSTMPLGDRQSTSSVYADDRAYLEDEVSIEAWRRAVTPAYFDAMSTRLVSGRVFGEQDTADSAPVAVVNAALALRLWPDSEAIGRRIRFSRTVSDDGVEVIGVVEDGKYGWIAER